MQSNWNQYDHKNKKRFCLMLYRQVKRYCNNTESYLYRWYGGKGVKCMFTSALEIEYLYKRDSVEQMTEPCLSRKRCNGNFSRGNCFFCEDIDEFRRLYKRIGLDT